MPSFHKLTQAEIAAIEADTRQSHARYDALVEQAGLAAGDGIELLIDAWESTQAVQMAFTKAIRRRGLDVSYTFDGERVYALIRERPEE
jgi:hypothetical protein